MRTLVLALVVGDLVLSAAVISYRATTGKPKHYKPIDAASVVIEIALLVWGVIWLAST